MRKLKVTVAKNSGFCYGVKNAVNIALNLNENAYTYGELINNEFVTDQLAERGIRVAKSVLDVQEGGVLLIRSHGAGKAVYEQAAARNIRVVDATCPFVKKIHEIVRAAHADKKTIVIAGDRGHPEVEGINAWCDNSAIILESCENVESRLAFASDCICLAAQTTFNREVFQSISSLVKKFAKQRLKTVEIFNTICYTTKSRQKEAIELARSHDAVVVIGGANSANTARLFRLSCDINPNTQLIQNAQQLDLNRFYNCGSVAVLAGASTPDVLIEQTHEKLKSINLTP